MNQLSQPIVADTAPRRATVLVDEAASRMLARDGDADIGMIFGLAEPCHRAFLEHAVAWCAETGEAAQLGVRLRSGAGDWVATAITLSRGPDDAVQVSVRLDDVAAAQRREAQSAYSEVSASRRSCAANLAQAFCSTCQPVLPSNTIEFHSLW